MGGKAFGFRLVGPDPIQPPARGHLSRSPAQLVMLQGAWRRAVFRGIIAAAPADDPFLTVTLVRDPGRTKAAAFDIDRRGSRRVPRGRARRSVLSNPRSGSPHA